MSSPEQLAADFFSNNVTVRERAVIEIRQLDKEALRQLLLSFKKYPNGLVELHKILTNNVTTQPLEIKLPEGVKSKIQNIKTEKIIILVQKFRHKLAVIEAIQYDGNNNQAIIDFCPGARREGNGLTIPTPAGAMTISSSDWVIRGIKGASYPCKTEIFKLIYEPVE